MGPSDAFSGKRGEAMNIVTSKWTIGQYRGNRAMVTMSFTASKLWGSRSGPDPHAWTFAISGNQGYD
jgi:hypothetical protein